jgi:hypothetical protein
MPQYDMAVSEGFGWSRGFLSKSAANEKPRHIVADVAGFFKQY